MAQDANGLYNSDEPLCRMRSHKGNMPSLPQTKYCPSCPAKFTRTTHLKRHLRSHTDERLYPCDICNRSEFTRSDLLLRHKRTCGQYLDRCRRKACEACAKSKTKCDLQYPCAKCSSRGRECVFQNDAPKSRDEGSERSRSTSPLSSMGGSAPPTPPLSPSPAERSWRTTSALESPGCLLLGLPDLPEFASSSEGSSNHSTPSEDFEIYGEFPFDIGTYENAISFDERSLFSSPPLSGLDTAFPGDSSSFFLAPNKDMDPFAIRIRSPGPTPPPPPSTPVGNTAGNRLMTRPIVSPDYFYPLDAQYLVDAFCAPPDPYLHLFCTHFLGQVPLIHAPTWNMEATLPILARIFRACGALFAKTPEGAAFAEAALESVTSDIMVGLGKVFNTDARDSGTNASRGQIQLLIALILLKTIPLFQREGERAALPNLQHHVMLVWMIRQTALLQRARSWRAPDWSIDPGALESAWIEWAEVETIKRALLFTYASSHHSSQGTYFASWPAEMEMEIELLPLPCDDALWHARSAAEWFAIAHTPSPHSVGVSRVYGINVQDALAARAAPPDTDSTDAVFLPPFGLFILIHAILRNIFPERSPPGDWSRCMQAASREERTHWTQLMLDNWLHMWLKSPQATRSQENGTVGLGEQSFLVCDSLPLYWLAQVALWQNS
ncbi:hypothetical protein DFH08DRAFT_1089106 [Mycena albidolilacea]|uniref:Uncharacterized protein n=1 Tax=Mycena albidolilacea TaxID=1033008 RepID=A0AAD6Z356_9AGAR|nr:hypothetical protein DFH08DRAFT_1089106 [Mycena albidolilacea]